MRDIKFRYIIEKPGSSIKPLKQYLLLEEIEVGKLEVPFGWIIIAKSEWTGLLDKNGKYGLVRQLFESFRLKLIR